MDYRILSETAEVNGAIKIGRGPASSPWEFAENIVKLAGLAYAFGFLIVLVNTARLGIPVIQVLEPVNVLIGAIPASFILGWDYYARFLKNSFRQMNESIASMEQRSKVLSDRESSDEIWRSTFLKTYRETLELTSLLLPFPFRFAVRRWVIDYVLRRLEALIIELQGDDLRSRLCSQIAPKIRRSLQGGGSNLQVHAVANAASPFTD